MTQRTHTRIVMPGLLAAGAPALQDSLPALLVQRTGPVLAVAAWYCHGVPSRCGSPGSDFR